MEYLTLPLTVLCLLSFAGMTYYHRLAQRRRIEAAFWRAVALANQEKVNYR